MLLFHVEGDAKHYWQEQGDITFVVIFLHLALYSFPYGICSIRLVP